MATLNELKAGECAEITEIKADKELKERLKMLGISQGSRVRLIKKTFFGLEYLVRTSFGRVGMRRNCAEKIFVKKAALEQGNKTPNSPKKGGAKR